jgi:hypothetical protein
MLPTELLVHFIRVLEFFSRQMNWDGLVKLLLNSTGKWIYPTRIRSQGRTYLKLAGVTGPRVKHAILCKFCPFIVCDTPKSSLKICITERVTPGCFRSGSAPVRSSSRVTKFIRHFSWSSLIRTSCEINEFNGT